MSSTDFEIIVITVEHKIWKKKITICSLNWAQNGTVVVGISEEIV